MKKILEAKKLYFFELEPRQQFACGICELQAI
jgi:hypothetical protein